LAAYTARNIVLQVVFKSLPDRSQVPVAIETAKTGLKNCRNNSSEGFRNQMQIFDCP